MIINYIKKFFPLFIFLFILLIITIINKNAILNIPNKNQTYENELNNIIASDDKEKIENINYEFILEDINNIERIIKNSISDAKDINKKASYYDYAQDIFEKKINEIVFILNSKLNDEDFQILFTKLEDFNKELEFECDEISKNYISSLDALFNINKLKYEKKKDFCYEILEFYSGYFVNNSYN